jgi:hypothetical protein
MPPGTPRGWWWKASWGRERPPLPPPGGGPGPVQTGVAHAPLVRTNVTARRAHERSRSSRTKERLIVFVVWSDLAEPESAARDVQLCTESVADRVDASPTDEHPREDGRLRLCPEGLVFALRNGATNDASFPAWKFRRTRDATILIERERRDFKIDKRRAGGLSSEKIFVGRLRAFVDARDGSEDCFTHCAAMVHAIGL